MKNKRHIILTHHTTNWWSCIISEIFID